MSDKTVKTIAQASMWSDFADPINDIGEGETVLEIDETGVSTRLRDPANVAGVRERIDPDDMKHFDVNGNEYQIGLNTEKFADVLAVPDKDDPVEISIDWETRSVDFAAGGVKYEFGGLAPETVADSPKEIPPVKDDEYPYNVHIRAPTDKLAKAAEIVDLSDSHNSEIRFVWSGESPGEFVIEGAGDTDKSSVNIHDDDDFEWVDDPPEETVLNRFNNDYVEKVIKQIEEDTIRIRTGPELPMHMWTTRSNGRIDTKLMIAPRIDQNE